MGATSRTAHEPPSQVANMAKVETGGWSSTWEATCPSCRKTWNKSNYPCANCGKNSVMAYQNITYSSDHFDAQLELKCYGCQVVHEVVTCPNDGTAIIGQNIRAEFNIPNEFAQKICTAVGIIPFAVLLIGSLGLLLKPLTMLESSIRDGLPTSKKWTAFMDPGLRSGTTSRRSVRACRADDSPAPAASLARAGRAAPHAGRCPATTGRADSTD